MFAECFTDARHFSKNEAWNHEQSLGPNLLVGGDKLQTVEQINKHISGSDE